MRTSFMGVSTKLARIDLTDSFGYFSDFCVNTCSSQTLAQIFVLLELINTIVRNTCGIVNARQQYICRDYKNSLQEQAMFLYVVLFHTLSRNGCCSLLLLSI